VPDHEFTKPTSASGYLEAMTRIIMTSGMNWHVVEAKWEDIRAGFLGFDTDKVRAMTDEDVERLIRDRRMIRNRRKIRAGIDNAAKIAQLDKTYGGFDKYLRAQGDYEKAVSALIRDFSFMGDSTAYFFLATVGETVPDWEEHANAQARQKGHDKARS
jgi:DNA-3-methyladenine glycosylase I